MYVTMATLSHYGNTTSLWQHYVTMATLCHMITHFIKPVVHTLPAGSRVYGQSMNHVSLVRCVINYYRNRSLKEQLKALRVKEAEDTKALEDMVQKVEENLVATTVSVCSLLNCCCSTLSCPLTGRS